MVRKINDEDLKWLTEDLKSMDDRCHIALALIDQHLNYLLPCQIEDILEASAKLICYVLEDDDRKN